MIIVGVNLDEACVRNVAVEITHNGFCACAQVWMRIKDGTGGWELTSKLQKQYHYTSYLA
jgi:hypothetical protein